MAKRSAIPKKLAVKVMFASDSTCCLCKSEKLKCQIHHIDENPGNNTFDNLAVICVYCHIDVHSSIPFVRNYTPELVTLYNSAWRKVVKLRLSPESGDSKSAELTAEAYLEANLDCHSWKVNFMDLTGPNLPAAREGQFDDVWDQLVELWIPKYSETAYQKFLPLFDEGLLQMQRRFDRLIQLFADVLPPDFRANLVRANRQLNTERTVYLRFNEVLSAMSLQKNEDINLFFYQRFIGVVRVLREISRDADARLRLIEIGDESL